MGLTFTKHFLTSNSVADILFYDTLCIPPSIVPLLSTFNLSAVVAFPFLYVKREQHGPVWMNIHKFIEPLTCKVWLFEVHLGPHLTNHEGAKFYLERNANTPSIEGGPDGLRSHDQPVSQGKMNGLTHLLNSLYEPVALPS